MYTCRGVCVYMFLQNGGNYPQDYMASQLGTLQSTHLYLSFKNKTHATHMPLDHQVLYPLHDKRRTLRNQLREHSYCLGSTPNILV